MTSAPAHSLKDLEPARIGQSTSNQMKLAIGQRNRVFGGHVNTLMEDAKGYKIKAAHPDGCAADFDPTETTTPGLLRPPEESAPQAVSEALHASSHGPLRVSALSR